ncbi:unnamed protein product [Cyclocybe aegerita]|uniref:Uncharacterized protein n=1 Tax=Cyclocybe aegerita TaxID=1973307 RepID=A0A8S0WAZ6_CYCAE|nr:unnamed protein product [Cyclocybe aegerita]
MSPSEVGILDLAPPSLCMELALQSQRSWIAPELMLVGAVGDQDGVIIVESGGVALSAIVANNIEKGPLRTTPQIPCLQQPASAIVPRRVTTRRLPPRSTRTSTIINDSETIGLDEQLSKWHIRPLLSPTSTPTLKEEFQMDGLSPAPFDMALVGMTPQIACLRQSTSAIVPHRVSTRCLPPRSTRTSTIIQDGEVIGWDILCLFSALSTFAGGNTFDLYRLPRIVRLVRPASTDYAASAVNLLQVPTLENSAYTLTNAGCIPLLLFAGIPQEPGDVRQQWVKHGDLDVFGFRNTNIQPLLSKITTSTLKEETMSLRSLFTPPHRHSISSQDLIDASLIPPSFSPPTQYVTLHPSIHGYVAIGIATSACRLIRRQRAVRWRYREFIAINGWWIRWTLRFYLFVAPFCAGRTPAARFP